MVVFILKSKQSRDNEQSTDDNGDTAQEPSSCTTKPNDYADTLNDTAHMDNNSEEEIPDLTVTQGF